MICSNLYHWDSYTKIKIIVTLITLYYFFIRLYELLVNEDRTFQL